MSPTVSIHVYIGHNEMKMLPETAPNFYEQFQKGNFVVRREDRRFNAVVVKSHFNMPAFRDLLNLDKTKTNLLNFLYISWAKPNAQ